MDIKGKTFVVVGGAGLIGSHTVDRLLKHDVKKLLSLTILSEVEEENLAQALKDPRTSVYDVGGDIMQTDILQSAFKGVDGVFHLAALWLLQCQYPHCNI